MINCIAIDDEPLALELISKYCSEIDYLNLKKTFTSPSVALVYIQKFPVDLIFLDIQMPDISGIDFCKLLPEPRMVIFTTAFSDYAVEGFNLSAVDYLLKPIKFNRFEQAVRKTREYFEYLNNLHTSSDKFIFVRSDYKLYKIAISEIIYIEALDNYIKIYTENNKPIIPHMSLKAILERLPAASFARIHRSYIINLTKTIFFSNKQVQVGKHLIPVGMSYEDMVKKLFENKRD